MDRITRAQDGAQSWRACLAGAVAACVLLAGCAVGTSASRGEDRSDASVITVPSPSSAADCRRAPAGPATYGYAERPATDPDLTSLDVYLPPGCGPAPVVIWVHGGGWRAGDKSAGFVERKAQWAASLGAALVSVNYRLSTPGSDVRWPDHGEDVAAAVAWVQQHGPELGLRPERMTLLGHSAGAHLVAMLGTDPQLLTAAGATPQDVACVVALDSTFDLAASPAEDLVVDAFGSDPEVIAAASPTVQVERNGPPSARFLVATRGGADRVAGAQAFVELIMSAGGSAQLVEVAGYSHAQASSQLGAPGEDRLTPPVTDFVRACAAE